MSRKNGHFLENIVLGYFGALLALYCLLKKNQMTLVRAQFKSLFSHITVAMAT